jgi:anti-anti-sigma regulatory factor/anti-sigma regulatory factor (Ser/Thr protein kinase)
MLKILKNLRLTVKIPFRLNADTMYSLIEEVIDKNQDLKRKWIRFDFSQLDWIDPVGVTVISNLIEFLKKGGASVSLIGYKNNSDAIKYLDESGFFKQHIGKYLNESAKTKYSTIALKLVSHKSSYYWIEEELMPWMAERSEVSKNSLSSIKVCFQEIFNNIRDHSTVETGCIFGQFDSKKNTIQIVLSDIGVGIPMNVKKLRPKLNDHECIKLATEEGFTTQTKVTNRGAGLDILIKNLVVVNNGVLNIRSVNGSLSCSKGSDGNVKKIARYESHFYPGTLLSCIFKVDSFKLLDQEEEVFEWTS